MYDADVVELLRLFYLDPRRSRPHLETAFGPRLDPALDTLLEWGLVKGQELGSYQSTTGEVVVEGYVVSDFTGVMEALTHAGILPPDAEDNEEAEKGTLDPRGRLSGLAERLAAT